MSFLLEPPADDIAPTIAPTIASRPATLAGVDWTGIASEARGMFALVDVAPGEGIRQAWGRRGDA